MIRLFFLFFLLVLVIALIFDFALSKSQDSGNPAWLIVGICLGFGVMLLAYRFRPKSERDQELIALMFGDLEDPIQRSIVVRMTIASLMHGLSVAALFSNSEDIARVSLQNGIAGDEVKTLVLIGLFATSFLWVLFEACKFYTIDEFWRTVAQGPVAIAGLILFVSVILWGVARDYLGAPEMPVVLMHVTFWVPALILIMRNSKTKR